jgi:hypothetical protein
VSRGEIVTALRTLFAAREQSAAWMKAARTPETRARILHWSRVENVGIMTTLLGVSLLCTSPFLSVAVAIWSTVDGVDRTGVHWWIWGIAIFISGCGAVLWAVATNRRQEACYADGQVAEGLVDRAIEHPGSGDDMTWFDLRISSLLPDGQTLRRRLHLEGEAVDRRVGGPIRFRHNMLDPDDLDDILFVDWWAG